jgi:hypothetical protein
VHVLRHGRAERSEDLCLQVLVGIPVVVSSHQTGKRKEKHKPATDPRITSKTRGTTGRDHGNYSKRQDTRKTRHQDKSKQAIAWRSRLYMPPRTKTAHSTTTAGNEAPDTTSTSPRRSARFAPAVPVASTSRVHVHALPATPAGQRILRPASARRLSAKAQAGDAPPSPAQRGKRKSPDVHGGEREDVRTKRARVRCPAEVRCVPCPFHCRFLFRFLLAEKG